MASSPGTDPIGTGNGSDLGTELGLSPPVPASDSSTPPSDSSSTSSPPSDSSSSPTPPTESPPPPEESPTLSPPPVSESPPVSPDPPQSSTPPPTAQSPPTTSSSPPPTPPSQSQPSPPVTSSSPPPSPSSPSTSTSPPTTTSPSLPTPALPNVPSSNSSQQTPVVFPPPQSDNSGGKSSPGGRLLSPPDAPAPPRHSSGGSRPTGSSSSNGGSNGSAVLIIGVVAGGIFILALLVACLLCFKKKKRQPYYSDPGHPPNGGDPYWNGRKPNDHVVKLPSPPSGNWGPPPGGNPSSDFSSPYSGQNQPGYGPPSPNVGGMMGGYNQSQFTYEELAAATGGFVQSNLLGQGGFGYVHKGVLPNGREVAVKSLKSGSGQGEREFQAEVEIISRVHHRHLVSLVGYCISDKQRMLVYEFVPNSTMEFHLHGKGQPVMEWPTRMRIALGSAKGLAYLHEDCNPRIIHRDIKSANILLDDNYEAMVADFGLAKLTSDNYTHVSTRVMGTFGYMAPEYASSGKLTEKSDVFSFGVMLLELITGKRPVDITNRNMEDGLVDWVRPLIPEALEKDDFSELVDQRLEGNYDHHEMARMIACASACIRHSARRRPKMSQIIRALDGNSSLDDLNEVPKKSPSNLTSINRGNETAAYDTGMYNADMMKFRKMVLNTQEYNPSEDGVTSEYGLNPSASSSDEFGPKQHHKP